jgi:hypothetical protein
MVERGDRACLRHFRVPVRLQDSGRCPSDNYRHLSGVSVEIRLPLTTKEKGKSKHGTLWWY